ncbi:gene transfer agent family protein [Limimaricola cinnabarinus]|uniref:gene transfer agent family protein n=1 Tax=Limimaricola cinnabarinus TaxID=1125964 RepID=UPI001C1FF847|nr:gene transfer agent family protein [Limimaricola cinnabarinus]
MANRFLGEATTKVDGESYTLRCDFNAMAHFEEETDMPALEAFEAFEAGKLRVKNMIAMMWAFLQHHHPDADMKLAGVILSEDVGVLQRVVAAASPTEAEAGDAGNGRAPRRRKAKAAG